MLHGHIKAIFIQQHLHVFIGLELLLPALVKVVSGLFFQEKKRSMGACEAKVQPGDLGEQISNLEVRFGVYILESSLHTDYFRNPAPSLG